MTSIKRMSIGIIVLHTLGDIAEDIAYGALLRLIMAKRLKRREIAVARGKDGQGIWEVAEAFVIKHVLHCSKDELERRLPELKGVRNAI